MKGDALDPKALIAEAYRIDGITEPECRSIFLDWALSMPQESDVETSLRALLDRHGTPGHPMTAVLQEGLGRTAPTGRRGGRRGRMKR